MTRLINRISLALGVPLLLVALLGGAIAMAQDSGGTTTPVPETTGTPDDSDKNEDTGDPEDDATPDDESAPEDGGSSGGSDSMKDGCDHGGHGAGDDEGSESETTSADEL